MAGTDPHAPAIREVVGTFSRREPFIEAAEALVAAGIPRSELSVLSSHDSLEAVVGHQGKPWREVLAALSGEMKYEGPLVTAGLFAFLSGPVGASVAALIAAGVGGMAAKELLDEISAVPDSEEFTRALEAGSLILWVGVADQTQEEKARGILTAKGAANIRVCERPRAA